MFETVRNLLFWERYSRTSSVWDVQSTFKTFVVLVTLNVYFLCYLLVSIMRVLNITWYKMYIYYETMCSPNLVRMYLSVIHIKYTNTKTRAGLSNRKLYLRKNDFLCCRLKSRFLRQNYYIDSRLFK